MTQNDAWLGFGYIGERQNQQRNVLDEEIGEEAFARLESADEMLLNRANELKLTEAQLFDWANSKQGRWYGDCWFGCAGQYAEQQLPKSSN